MPRRARVGEYQGPKTRGRDRAAKDKSVQEDVVEVDDEVTFNTITEHSSKDTTLEMDTTQGTKSSGHRSTRSAPDESRIDRIEGNVREVQSQVGKMSDKLDLLVTAMYESQPLSHSTPPRTAATPANAYSPGPAQNRRDDTILPPRRIRDAQNYDGYVDRYVDREHFTFDQQQGKLNHADSETIKPYMYIEREECQTQKQRLDARCTMSPLEYIHAVLTLLMDPASHHIRDHSHIMSHLSDVTHDAMERDWPAVRRWSQYVWDSVEKGRFTWDNTQRIQNERIRIAMTGGGSTTNQGGRGKTQHSNNRGGSSGLKDIVCREFNTVRGCSHRFSHDDGVVRYNHLCAYCDSVNRHCPGHNIVGCERKLQHSNGEGRRQYDNPPQMLAHQYPGTFQQQHQLPHMLPSKQRNFQPQYNAAYPKNA